MIYGNGTYTYANGELYIGEFINGLKCGYGISYYPNNYPKIPNQFFPIPPYLVRSKDSHVDCESTKQLVLFFCAYSKL